MSSNNPFPVPSWVRAVVCLIGCISIPLLILAAYNGLQLNPFLISAVGIFALQSTRLAFKNN